MSHFVGQCGKCADKFVSFCRPGGHFSPHFDGPWVPRENERSVYTVVIYLNDDYESGYTMSHRLPLAKLYTL